MHTPKPKFSVHFQFFRSCPTEVSGRVGPNGHLPAAGFMYLQGPAEKKAFQNLLVMRTVVFGAPYLTTMKRTNSGMSSGA